MHRASGTMPDSGRFQAMAMAPACDLADEAPSDECIQHGLSVNNCCASLLQRAPNAAQNTKLVPLHGGGVSAFAISVVAISS